MANEVKMPEPPLKVAPIDHRSGMFAREWLIFFRQVFLRAGGVTALSNLDLAEIPADHEARISNLEALTTSQGNTISNLRAQVDGLSQEPVA